MIQYVVSIRSKEFGEIDVLVVDLDVESFADQSFYKFYQRRLAKIICCLLYTSDAADE